jgi:hypothetical protein
MRPLPLRVYAALAVVFTAIGIWIIIAPTVVGYQPEGQRWRDGTYNDVIVGGLLVLISLGLLLTQITATIRARRRAARR